MNGKPPFSVKNKLKSFVFAFSGLKTFFKIEYNAWIHFVATVSVIVLGIALHVSIVEWCILIFAIGLVFISEIFNTAIELVTDKVSPEYNEMAKKIKDLAAGAVLFASIIAILIGFLVFFF